MIEQRREKKKTSRIDFFSSFSCAAFSLLLLLLRLLLRLPLLFLAATTAASSRWLIRDWWSKRYSFVLINGREQSEERPCLYLYECFLWWIINQLIRPQNLFNSPTFVLDSFVTDDQQWKQRRSTADNWWTLGVLEISVRRNNYEILIIFRLTLMTDTKWLMVLYIIFFSFKEPKKKEGEKRKKRVRYCRFLRWLFSLV